ncbi:MAG: hypothetical protein AAFY71_12775 [Bacteroidota bacterium]
MRATALLLFLCGAILTSLSQSLVLTNGKKEKIISPGTFLEIRSAKSFDPTIQTMGTHHYMVYYGMLIGKTEDSVSMMLYEQHEQLKRDGISMELRLIKYEEGNRSPFALSIEEMDMIKMRKSPDSHLATRIVMIGGGLLFLYGIHGYLSSLLVSRDGFEETLPSAYTGSIVLGAAGLSLARKKEFNLSPRLKGIRTKKIWNIE